MSPYHNNMVRVYQHVLSLGYHPVYVCVHGSQNYGMDIHTDEHQSDFDYKCVILPTLEDLVKNAKPVSTTLEFEGGHIDLKDIRSYMEALLKCNPSYVETLYTPHYTWHDEGKQLFGLLRVNRDNLLKEMAPVFVKALRGMFFEKKKSMCQPYPHVAELVQKYGYDGKQVHHMYRLLLMLYDFEEMETMCLLPPEDAKELLIELKLNKYPLHVANILVAEFEQELNDLCQKLEQKYPGLNPETKTRMLQFSQDAVLEYCSTPEGRKRSA